MGYTMLPESDVIKIKDSAFENGQFVPYFQPQYNHSTGLIVGAEALARWIHPELGIIPPSVFIPVLEKCEDIGRLDLAIFEQVCSFIKDLIEIGITPPPISQNIARQDLYQENFIASLEEIRKKYSVPVELVRIEITESSAIGEGEVEYVNAIIECLHSFGYVVEMDDFGSGYSSLNMLKNLDFDVLKLDMDFLTDGSFDTGRSGTILSSIIRMTRLIGIPVIAEGVETKKQADFLLGIGCENIQGFYYSKPLPSDKFIELIKTGNNIAASVERDVNHSFDATRFLDPNSAESLVFTEFMGPAAIFYYSQGNLETVRVNEKYLREIGMNMTVDEAIRSDILAGMDNSDKAAYISAIERAIKSGEEQFCETRHLIRSECCGDDCIYIRSEIKLIGKSQNEYLLYVLIRNVTNEKKKFIELSSYEHSFRQVTEQVNIYFWEYNISTKEMRPCFRCMRDLGLPAIVRNYPEPAIEAGIFPADYADMYRDWHKQLEQGVPELEAVIPLTVGRVPFRVKYVTEFDDLGRPIKAYGSATYIVD